MTFINEVIDATNLSSNAKAMYKRAIAKLGITNVTSLLDSDIIINEINNQFISDESKKIALNGICKVLEGKELFNVYNDERNRIKRKILYDKSDNRKQLPMSYVELMDVPNHVINKDKTQELIDKFFLYMNIMYPLRLDYYNVPINKEDTNYMTYDGKTLTFFLNDFKTVKSMGPQVITYNDSIINEYFDIIKPEYLLYEKTGKIFNSRVAFGNHLANLFKKYANKKLTINDIRKIHESNTIQSDGYAKMTNREKDAKHHKLLHKTSTAQSAYNIII